MFARVLTFCSRHIENNKCIIAQVSHVGFAVPAVQNLEEKDFLQFGFIHKLERTSE